MCDKMNITYFHIIIILSHNYHIIYKMQNEETERNEWGVYFVVLILKLPENRTKNSRNAVYQEMRINEEKWGGQMRRFWVFFEELNGCLVCFQY